MMNLNSARARKELREEFGAPDPLVTALRELKEANSRWLAQTCHQVISQTGIKTGDVVQDSKNGLCVITGNGLSSYYQRRLPTGGRTHSNFSSIKSGWVTMEIVFRPPETHVHPFAVYPVRKFEEYGEEYYARAKRLQAFVASKIPQEDCLEHDQYGKFWSRQAVARLIKEFEDLES